jgi:hypothetical protein
MTDYHLFEPVLVIELVSVNEPMLEFEQSLVYEAVLDLDSLWDHFLVRGQQMVLPAPVSQVAVLLSSAAAASMSAVHSESLTI